MPPKRKKSMKEPAREAVYQLKITLMETSPPIWRRLLISADATLGDLNYALQAVMGWTNSHLHQFVIDEIRYSDPRFELDEYDSDVEDEFSVELRDVAPRVGVHLLLEYDFGDGWEHDVVVEKITQAVPGKTCPTCVAGKRACPPEDCGGVWGYADFLEAIEDPKHEEHEQMLEWVGGAFDAKAFDVDDLNGRLISDVGLFASWR
jgi:Plasmid pRiA4b ORF-3-like protein